MSPSRRSFLKFAAGAIAATAFHGFSFSQEHKPMIHTVLGPIEPEAIGLTLAHEHLLVDFVAAVDYRQRWEHDVVIAKVLPHLQAIKQLGCRSLIDYTPAYLGRDPILLRKLSERSGVQILTNTGYYGGADPKTLPSHFFEESAEQTAERWIREFDQGIDGTDIRPGFIKISVNPGPLNDNSKKLIRAAALTHLRTGLTITAHTGVAVPAMEQVAILKEMNVSPVAFVWTHAQNEKDISQHIEGARQGAWVSLDHLTDTNIPQYIEMLSNMKRHGQLGRTLLSHDAGWYRPGQPDGGNFRPFTTLFEKFLPAAKEAGFTQEELDQVLIANPREAYTIRVRRDG
jgi:phosphotriesterase-related protein